jgi:CelD/BcsL family acetyltransferase involved in cellulose biosynthesis
MLTFEPFAGSLDDWGRVLAALPGREIFQSPAWLRYLAEAHRGEPIVLALKNDGATAGYFAGLTIRKAGLKILGSPFPGWMTERMGLRLMPGVSRREAVESLCRYAFRQLQCSHLEFADADITPDDLVDLGFSHTIYKSLVVDLAADEDVVYSRLSATSCRYRIRKAQRLGATVEEASDIEFADEYYAQLKDVFAKQGLVPPYDAERTRLLIKHLLPTGDLLLLRVRDPQGRSIATGIFLGMHDTAYFWGNASWRQDQHFCPNELLQWHVMRYWKRRGMTCYDLCGGGEGYKMKYGGEPIETFRFVKSKYPWIGWARNAAWHGFHLYQRIAGGRNK